MNENQLGLSIITPVYNGETFIEDCINNVIEQKCPNVEHIIIDGNSEDRTLDIIRKYAHKYEHIKWLSEKDKGQSDAMNKGIKLAKGSIISFLNVDDYYESSIFEKVIERFTDLKTPSILIGNCNIWNDGQEIIEVNKPKTLDFKKLLYGHNITPFPLNPSAYFYHKCLHEIIGFYDVEDHYSMDIDFILRAVQTANAIYVDELWGNHRYIEGTKSYTDKHSGAKAPRMSKLLSKHRQSLPILTRVFCLAVFLCGKNETYLRLKYFVKNPWEFPYALKKKILGL